MIPRELRDALKDPHSISVLKAGRGSVRKSFKNALEAVEKVLRP